MDFQFQCPHCNYVITEKDFEENEKILSHLNEIFYRNKQVYIQKLENQLYSKWQSEEATRLKAALLTKENQLLKINQQQIDALNEKLNQQNILLKNNEYISKQKIAEITLNLQVKKNQEIEELKNIINQQKVILEKYKLDSENQVLKAINKINSQKEAEINNLKEIIENLKAANLQFKVIQNKTKGENFEHDVEAELRKLFEPEDVIIKITAQEQKADYLHEIRQELNVIGKIVYEVKNAEWNNNWEKKLFADMVKVKAKYGIIVCTSFNKKYPGIPFKRADYYNNIYLCDSESFYFVGQILKTLVQIEANLTNIKNQEEYQEKAKRFNEWKLDQFPTIIKIIEDNCTRIESAEESIIKKVKEIEIARKKIFDKWLKQIKTFLINLNF